MKTNIKQSIKIIIIGVLMAGTFAFAANWAGPTQSSPSANTPAPINMSAVNQGQTKSGALGLGGLTVYGTSSGAANIYGHVTNTASAKNLYVSGKIGIGIQPSSSTQALEIAGTPGTIKTSSLAHPASPFNLKRICSNSTGLLYLCSVAPPTGAPPNCSGSQIFASPGTYTFTTSYCASTITVKVWGAGGPGGGGSSAGYGGYGGSGGGGGGYTSKQISVSPFQSFTVQVGASIDGGAGGAANGYPGGSPYFPANQAFNPTGPSKFLGSNASLIAINGEAGAGSDYSQASYILGNGGPAYGGTTNTTGSPGQLGDAGSGCSGGGGTRGGNGGGTSGGGGGGGVGGASQCNNGLVGNDGSPGGWGVGGGAGGGGGEEGSGHSGGAGGRGGDGRVEITWP